MCVTTQPNRPSHLLKIRLVFGGADHSDVGAGDVVVRLARDEHHGLHGGVVGDLVRPDLLNLLPELPGNGVHLLRPVDPGVTNRPRFHGGCMGGLCCVAFLAVVVKILVQNCGRCLFWCFGVLIISCHKYMYAHKYTSTKYVCISHLSSTTYIQEALPTC